MKPNDKVGRDMRGIKDESVEKIREKIKSIESSYEIEVGASDDVIREYHQNMSNVLFLIETKIRPNQFVKGEEGIRKLVDIVEGILKDYPASMFPKYRLYTVLQNEFHGLYGLLYLPVIESYFQCEKTEEV